MWITFQVNPHIHSLIATTAFLEFHYNTNLKATVAPVLLALFSIVTLLAEQLHQQQRLHIATAAWYRKRQPTFSDALASVREHFWQKSNFYLSQQDDDMVKIPKAQLRLWQQTIAWAA
jgi:hypothetical protein